MKERNNIKLWTEIDGQLVSHFKMREFENKDGLVMVHSSLLQSLEQVRRDLSAICKKDVSINITDSIRTQAELETLASHYGWIDEGGTVSRRSKHLAEFGGIAVDLVAVVVATKGRVPQEKLGRVCRRYFDWVKDDYGSGHVHADNRYKAAATVDGGM